VKTEMSLNYNTKSFLRIRKEDHTYRKPPSDQVVIQHVISIMVIFIFSKVRGRDPRASPRSCPHFRLRLLQGPRSRSKGTFGLRSSSSPRSKVEVQGHLQGHANIHLQLHLRLHQGPRSRSKDTSLHLHQGPRSKVESEVEIEGESPGECVDIGRIPEYE
jgi:hypothetical protein